VIDAVGVDEAPAVWSGAVGVGDVIGVGELAGCEDEACEPRRVVVGGQGGDAAAYVGG